jgi:hypothetical protein
LSRAEQPMRVSKDEQTLTSWMRGCIKRARAAMEERM